jgi:TonB-dependent Receptor Plug Domain
VSRATFVCLYIPIFFFSFLNVEAQSIKEEKQSLISFLKIIETQYNVQFSYADANLIGKTINIPSKQLSFIELLNYLENNTNLIFERLNDTLIVIKKGEQKPFITQILDEVVLTNYLTKGIALKNDGATTIKPSVFGILPGLTEPDILQAIQALPGIQSVDERVSNVNIRGGTHDQNLILWNGIKMYQSGHFFGLISAFNPYLTQEVIVSKNGTSAMYGDGVSSIIDMRSSNNISKEPTGGAGFNLINADVFTKIPLSKKIEIQLSARRSLTDLILTPTYDQYFKRIFQDTDLTNNLNNSNSISRNERFYFYDVTTKLLYNISKKDKLRVNFLNVFNNLNYDEQSRINNVDEALNSKLTQSNLATSIEYTRNWSTKFSTSTQLYFSNYDLDATNFDVINNQRLIQENQVIDNGLKMHYQYEINDNLLLNGGYQFTEVGISNLEDLNNPVFRSFIKEVLRTHAVFNEVKFVSNSHNTNARVGLRANYFNKFSKTLIEPRFSFNQRFLDHFRLEILGELKSQTTSQIIDLQNDFLGIEKRRWILSNNSNIPIIQSKQLSTGIHFSKNNLTISTEAYIKNVDGITTRSQGFQNQYQFVNAIGSYQVKGIDFLINKQFDNISTWLSYSYSKNDYTFKDLNFSNPFPNNVDIRHAFTFAGTYSINKFKFALGMNWRTGKPVTEPDANNPITNNFINFNAPNSSNLDDYLRADFSSTYTFKAGNNSNAIVGFSLWNILNKANIINTYYNINDDNTVSKVEILSLGITPNFSFRVTF